MVEVRQMVFGLIIMSGVIAGMTGFYLDIAENHNLDIDDELGTFQRINDINNISNSMEGTIFESLKDVPVFGEIAALTISGFNTLRFVFGIPTIFSGIFIPPLQFIIYY